MKIEHVAIYVHELEKAKEFFEKYFAAKAGKIYHNLKTGFSSYFLTFENGARLEIMNRPELAESQKELVQAGYIHVAFSAGSKENVDLLTARLKQDGYTVISGPRVTGDGYYESAILGFEGNQIEITE